ncbi:acetyl-CoA synthetase-like protein [Zopfia rhizophila CBS 207.26]|uniref:Acetyl-CoA synthetase-like protein n=1 Tax=Zopfia rhizophila CBS 207.26 TaxID=1314779 RepID=A0A6A6DDD8_9PEZI|nr:acetyl-CoA synthetase-like protein [Zopfia rhizophila CBS 207.26]
MPFLVKEHVQIPTKDMLSWACDGPAFDQDKPLFIDAANDSNSISAAEAKTLIRKLITGFRNAGLKKGDTVLIHSFNNIYYPVIVLPVIGLGGVFTGSNPSYTASELKHQLQASKAKFIMSEPEILETISVVGKEVRIPQSRILFLDSSNQQIPSGFNSWKSLLDYGSEDSIKFDNEETSKQTTAMLLFSSGTTGLPKPAILVALPFSHVAAALSTFISPLRSGHVQYIMRRFEVNAYLSHVSKYPVTDITIVPPMVTAIVSCPIPEGQKKKALRDVRSAWAGAAPLDKSMQAKFQTLMRQEAPFTQIWGMTETTCYAAVFPYPENDDTGSVGRFVPNIDVKLIDRHGNDITGYGVRGELCVSGPTVVRGYMGVERKEGSGLWYIVDRKKELIKVRGFQVAPAELEGVLLDHPDILDAAVIGIPSSERDSELPRAYVVRKDGKDAVALGEEEVMKWLKGRLAGYKRLEGRVRFVESIPKTPSGKILKRVLREIARREIGARL